MNTVTLKGQAVEVAGVLPVRGQSAPALLLTNNDLIDVTLVAFSGKKKVLNIFPSIDTPTCAASVRKFNVEAASHPDTVVLCISADLPFAQKRFCGGEGLDQVVSLSCFRHPEFAQAYGVKLGHGPLGGLCARAVVVLDQMDVVRYVELVSEIAEEPDYKAALAAL